MLLLDQCLLLFISLSMQCQVVTLQQLLISARATKAEQGTGCQNYGCCQDLSSLDTPRYLRRPSLPPPPPPQPTDDGLKSTCC